jgi:hypothetical protein
MTSHIVTLGLSPFQDWIHIVIVGVFLSLILRPSMAHVTPISN